MIRQSLHILSVFAFFQVLIGNEGDKWVAADYSELEKEVQLGDSYAIGYLALVHAHGEKGRDISISDALKFAEMSAEKDHWLGHFAMGFLARFVPYGPDSQKVRAHYLKAFQDPDGEMIRAASKGDPLAAYALAEIFTSDEVRPELVPDLKMAAAYYEIASQKGYDPASVQLALFKLHTIADPGLGIEKNLKMGIELLSNAAKRNLPDAHHYLGRCYFKGIGVEADNQMAFVHFQAAADKGKSLSQLLVADFYAYGVSGPAKLDLAFRYARLASVQEEEKALLKIQEYENLRLAEKDSDNKVPSPPMEVIEGTDDVPVLPAPELPPPPPPPSQERLPSVYAPLIPKTANVQEGMNTKPEESQMPLVPSSNSTAKEITNEAKNAYWGKGGSIDLQLAYSLFLEASDKGDGEAARYLGMMFMQGKGVEKNPKQALDWFEIAAQLGDKLAEANLEKLKGVLGSR